jgi:hypothetical protein
MPRGTGQNNSTDKNWQVLASNSATAKKQKIGKKETVLTSVFKINHPIELVIQDI